MKMMKVLITNQIPKKVAEKLVSLFDVDYHQENSFLSRKELVQRIKEVEILVCPLSVKVDRELIDHAPKLRLIANFGAGYDNIDTFYAKEKGIFVTNAPATLSSIATAELTVGLMIDLMRKITFKNKDCYDGKFVGWMPNYGLGKILYQKTVGIIGMGTIGQEVAKRLACFGVEVLYHSRHKKDVPYSFVSKKELLERSDVVTIHTAYAKELHHMISDVEFDQMKTTAFLINASRGPVVSEKALIKALNEEKIAGAALDVFEFEPKISDALKSAKHLLMTPHLGNASIEAREEMAQCVYDNLIAFKNNISLPNRVE